MRWTTRSSDGTQRGIDAAIATFARSRRRDPRGAVVAAAGLARLRHADLDHRARRRLRGMGAHAARRFRRARAAAADARRVGLGRRLCPGGAAAARIARRTEGGDGRARCGADRGAADRGAEDRRGAEWDTSARSRASRCRSMSPAIRRCRSAPGFGDGGLPVAIQLVGKPFQEATVLRVADAFEKATPHRSRRPDIA